MTVGSLTCGHGFCGTAGRWPGHRLICTGGTGAMIAEAVPDSQSNAFNAVRAAGISNWAR